MANKILLTLCMALMICCGCNASKPKGKNDPSEHSKASFSTALKLNEESRGEYRHEVTYDDGTVFRFTISVPEGYDGSKATPLVVALHSSGEVKPFYGHGFIDDLIMPAALDKGLIIAVRIQSKVTGHRKRINQRSCTWSTASLIRTTSMKRKSSLPDIRWEEAEPGIPLRRTKAVLEP